MIKFFVPGTPEPKGSTKQKSNDSVMNGGSWDADKRMRAWLARVATAAAVFPSIPGAVRVTLLFILPRKATVKRPYVSVKPDLDKLQRCVFDALEKSGRIENDSRIVSIVADKIYQDKGFPAAHETGVHVTVKAMPDQFLNDPAGVQCGLARWLGRDPERCEEVLP